jgi:hypothetical protein
VEAQISRAQSSLDRYFHALEEGRLREGVCIRRIEELSGELTSLEARRSELTEEIIGESAERPGPNRARGAHRGRRAGPAGWGAAGAQGCDAGDGRQIRVRDRGHIEPVACQFLDHRMGWCSRQESNLQSGAHGFEPNKASRMGPRRAPIGAEATATTGKPCRLKAQVRAHFVLAAPRGGRPIGLRTRCLVRESKGCWIGYSRGRRRSCTSWAGVAARRVVRKTGRFKGRRIWAEGRDSDQNAATARSSLARFGPASGVYIDW